MGKGATSTILVAAALLLSLDLLVPAPAVATHVACGDVITEDTLLDSDLLDCPSGGLVIGADGVTIDLGGHTIDGPDPPFQGFDPLIDGIDNRAGHDDLVVRNGHITEFFDGVHLGRTGARPARVLLEDLEIEGVEGVIGVADESLFQRLHITSENFAMTLGLERSVLRGNSMSAPAPRRFGASVVLAPSNSVIERNEVTGGGIYIQGGSSSEVLRNTASRHLDVGIAVRGDGHVVERNTLLETSTGIIVSQGASTIRRNDVIGSGNDGIRAEGGTSLLVHNVVVANRDDGIEVRSPGTRVAKNIATDNRLWGIQAVAGVIDEGGNRASGNGIAEQCLNIACK
jgi:Right handed beta helix region